MTTLLLTSSVYVSAPFVKISDSTDRSRLTLESLEQWLNIKDDLRIVICDGSGYDFSNECLKYFPTANIECLSFINDNISVQKYGKGYGEGEIVKYALEHSKYLDQADYFVKCTSRLYVKNISEILTHWNNSFQCDFSFKNIWSLRTVKPVAVETRFYIVRKDFYLLNFAESYKSVRDFDGYYLEHSFFDALTKKNRNIYQYFFPRPAYVEGVSASSGSPCQINRLEHRLKHTYRRLIVKANEHFF